jgi:hypothetical protein
MAIQIPQCPGCHSSNVVLAPIPPNVVIAEIDCGDLPVSCTECRWRGPWKLVIYVSV